MDKMAVSVCGGSIANYLMWALYPAGCPADVSESTRESTASTSGPTRPVPEKVWNMVAAVARLCHGRRAEAAPVSVSVSAILLTTTC